MGTNFNVSTYTLRCIFKIEMVLPSTRVISDSISGYFWVILVPVINNLGRCA